MELQKAKLSNIHFVKDLSAVKAPLLKVKFLVSQCALKVLNGLHSLYLKIINYVFCKEKNLLIGCDKSNFNHVDEGETFFINEEGQSLAHQGDLDNRTFHDESSSQFFNSSFSASDSVSEEESIHPFVFSDTAIDSHAEPVGRTEEIFNEEIVGLRSEPTFRSYVHLPDCMANINLDFHLLKYKIVKLFSTFPLMNREILLDNRKHFENNVFYNQKFFRSFNTSFFYPSDEKPLQSPNISGNESDDFSKKIKTSKLDQDNSFVEFSKKFSCDGVLAPDFSQTSNFLVNLSFKVSNLASKVVKLFAEKGFENREKHSSFEQVVEKELAFEKQVGLTQERSFSSLDEEASSSSVFSERKTEEFLEEAKKESLNCDVNFKKKDVELDFNSHFQRLTPSVELGVSDSKMFNTSLSGEFFNEFNNELSPEKELMLRELTKKSTTSSNTLLETIPEEAFTSRYSYFPNAIANVDLDFHLLKYRIVKLFRSISSQKEAKGTAVYRSGRDNFPTVKPPFIDLNKRSFQAETSFEKNSYYSVKEKKELDKVLRGEYDEAFKPSLGSSDAKSEHNLSSSEVLNLSISTNSTYFSDVEDDSEDRSTAEGTIIRDSNFSNSKSDSSSSAELSDKKKVLVKEPIVALPLHLIDRVSQIQDFEGKFRTKEHQTALMSEYLNSSRTPRKPKIYVEDTPREENISRILKKKGVSEGSRLKYVEKILEALKTPRVFVLEAPMPILKPSNEPLKPQHMQHDKSVIFKREETSASSVYKRLASFPNLFKRKDSSSSSISNTKPISQMSSSNFLKVEDIELKLFLQSHPNKYGLQVIKGSLYLTKENKARAEEDLKKSMPSLSSVRRKSVKFSTTVQEDLNLSGYVGITDVKELKVLKKNPQSQFRYKIINGKYMIPNEYSQALKNAVILESKIEVRKKQDLENFRKNLKSSEKLPENSNLDGYVTVTNSEQLKVLKGSNRLGFSLKKVNENYMVLKSQLKALQEAVKYSERPKFR